MELLSSLPLGPFVRARRNRKQEFDLLLCVGLNWIFTVESPPQKGVIAPKILANGHTDLMSITIPSLISLRRLKIPSFIKNIIGRKQGLGLSKNTLTLFQN